MRVIFNADDFGLTSGINEGIIQSFKNGLLSSASLVVSGEAIEEAIAFAKDNPDLDTGIHLVISDEQPVLSPRCLSSIISKGTYFPSRRKIQTDILTRKIDYVQVEAEWSAQIEKVFNSGIPISHLDSHQFMHLFPLLFPICLRVITKYGIPYIRTSILDPISPCEGLRRLLQCISLKSWTKYFVSPRITLPTKTIASIGFIKSGGRMNSDYVLSIIDKLRKKQICSVVEVIVHPGIGDLHTSNKYKHWHYQWKKDLELLLDRSLKEAFDQRGVEITSYGKLI